MMDSLLTRDKENEALANRGPQNLNTGVVTNIQHFTIHDGPGIRTEVFLKGCPLRCRWCSNPEGLKTSREIGIYASKCIGINKCGYCLESCPVADQDPFVIHEGKVTGINQDVCTDCLACADACPANALIVWGKTYTVEDVMKEVLSDKDFYDRSGGGITISGGEALMQWEFALEIFKECRKNGIHTCLESSLHYKSSALDHIFPYTDLVISDIKHMDDSVHKKYTGVGNKLVMDNIKKTVDMGMPLILRIPVVPGVNDTIENISNTSDFILTELGNKVLQIQLLPYRQLGVEKYQTLGMKYPMEGVEQPEREVWEKNILQLVELMKSKGIPAAAGANTKIDI